MSIPTPQDLIRDQAPIVQRHVDLLAERLRATKPYGARFIVDNHGVPYEYQKAVAAEFVKHGWDVAWHNDQRDGSSVSFTAAAKGGQ